MWTDYSIRYIKNNGASSCFLAAISFAATTLLSLVCSMAYNMWMDHVSQIIAVEGSYTTRPEPLAYAYGFVIVAACISLIFMIHNAFAVPMNSRIHQLGILQSVGATPKQIRSFLIQETMILCAVPLILGVAAGIGLSVLLLEALFSMTGGADYYEVKFYFHFLVVVVSMLASGITIWISAWLPARKVSKMTPLTTLGYGVETAVKKMRRFSLTQRLFGLYGELAQKSLFARRKELRTSIVSLLFAFISLIALLNIEAISQVSTRYTYFERFRDKWDMMITTQDKYDDLGEEIRSIDGMKACIVYRKAISQISLDDSLFSEELKSIGITNLNTEANCDANGQSIFKAPIYVLDDQSFDEYCTQNNLANKGVVVINKIWNSTESTRKHREYLTIVDATKELTIQLGENQLTISEFANEMPQIKEEYEQYSFSMILSESYQESLVDVIPNPGVCYNIFLENIEEWTTVEAKIEAVLKEKYGLTLRNELREAEQMKAKYTIASRPQDEIDEIRMRSGLKMIVISFAGFLAGIGIINMFSFTLGQIFQRRKEFVRYFSIGLSPNGMKKMLTMEALIICLRPLIISVVINVPLLALTLNAADISLSEFMPFSPLVPVSIFTAAVFAFIVLAYFLGGKKIINSDFVEVIKDETML